MSLVPYIKIARPDHWFKNIFMLPGIIYALMQANSFDQGIIVKILFGIISTCFIASSNYVINEWLDAEFDKFHPVKKNRPAITVGLKAKYVYMEYFLLSSLGLSISFLIGTNFFIVSTIFLLMGIIYNVFPIRSKDIAYIDVLSESINNPIRLMLGWFLIINGGEVLPISLIIGYWMAGAFLMSIKRFAEYRSIGEKSALLYRKSFKYYNEDRLLTSAVFYAMCSTLFMGIFLVKHKLELIISFPFLCLIFVWYLSIGLKENSIVQTHEKLFKTKGFLLYSLFLGVLIIILSFVNIPFLYSIFMF